MRNYSHLYSSHNALVQGLICKMRRNKILCVNNMPSKVCAYLYVKGSSGALANGYLEVHRKELLSYPFLNTVSGPGSWSAFFEKTAAIAGALEVFLGYPL